MLQQWADTIKTIADAITAYVTVWVLIGAGLFFTFRSRFVQIRHLPTMLRLVLKSRRGADGGISSFQAFTMSLAARVGVGNVFGVAAALLLGGPGAVFWMWIVALVGMATSFFESTLAQVFKVRAADGTFRGGPAYYMLHGLKNRALGLVFAIIAVVTCGIVITMVQANAISSTLAQWAHTPPTWCAVILLVFSSLVIFGGIRSVARVAEILAPLMALIYVLVATFIVVVNIKELGSVLGLIITSAFSARAGVAGLGAGFMAALVNGVQRGLFSNEAGQGTAPNASATATVDHPVSQGMIQSLGVFVDTIIVCTATAFIILVAGPGVWSRPDANPATLTTLAIMDQVGDWAQIPMAIMIFVLAFSSIIAAYVYSEVNMDFVVSHPAARWSVRVLCVTSVVLGSLFDLELVWNTVDIAMAIMTVTNVIAVLALHRWVLGALQDYEAQVLTAGGKNAGPGIVFKSRNNPFLPGDLQTDGWLPVGGNTSKTAAASQTERR